MYRLYIIAVLFLNLSSLAFGGGDSGSAEKLNAKCTIFNPEGMSLEPKAEQLSADEKAKMAGLVEQLLDAMESLKDWIAQAEAVLAKEDPHAQHGDLTRTLVNDNMTRVLVIVNEVADGIQALRQNTSGTKDQFLHDARGHLNVVALRVMLAQVDLANKLVKTMELTRGSLDGDSNDDSLTTAELPHYINWHQEFIRKLADAIVHLKKVSDEQSAPIRDVQNLSPTSLVQYLLDITSAARLGYDVHFDASTFPENAVIQVDLAALKTSIDNLEFNANEIQRQRFPHTPFRMRYVISYEHVQNPMHYIGPDRRFAMSSNMEAGAFLKISVDDNGGGIPSDELPKMFHLGKKHTARVGGTGKGLPRIQLFAYEHGGGVEASNTEINGQKGARFSIYLPFNPPKNPMDDL